MKKKFIIAGLLLLPVLAFVGCGEKEVSEKKKGETLTKIEKVEEEEKSEIVDKVIEAPENLPIAEIKIKGYGIIKAELYPHKAPNTVANFTELANSNFYDGLIVHRLIQDFMLQGGCPLGNGTGDAGYGIKGEFAQNGVNINDIAHTKGVLSMARSQDPDSGGSQFFIMTGDAPHLDGSYAAFGKVIEGIEIVDKINVAKVAGESPVEEIVIEDITVDLNGNDQVETKKIK
ncbi:peptidylprolyl isomerase [uncultured Clostridium sp.]|uniref:peptidylprolyl isomerase n=1 Tax=uncultured Clostridium sp. TaxID=59620 RepID=UPI00262A03E0|nr:peptidylprolyl isomerase [uncultured Clostridium sp.]